MPGYNNVPNTPSQYLCSYCRLLLREAMQMACGHFCCESCIASLLQGDHAVCPIDGSRIPRNQIFPDNFVRREVLSLVFQCINQGKGCGWKGEVRSYEMHLGVTCEFVTIPCIHSDCGMTVLKRDLPTHLVTDCKHRLVTCEHCNKEIILANMEKHLIDECGKVPVTCSKCNKQLTRDAISVHLSPILGDCPEVEGPCPFSQLGCPNKQPMKKEARRIHLKDNTANHLSVLLIDYNRIKQSQTPNLQGACNMEVVPSVRETSGIPPRTLQQIEELVKQNLTLKNQLKELQDVVYAQISSAPSASQGNRFTGGGTRAMGGSAGRFTSLGNAPAPENEVAEIKRQLQASQENFAILQRRVDTQDNMAGLRNVNLADLEEQVRENTMVTYDGVLMWKITDIARKRNDAVSGRTYSHYSTAFYTSRYGYKCCARIYFNGDGIGRGTHISLFFVIMRGNYDAVLRWPFRQKVTLMLIDQNNIEHVIDAFRPDPDSSSFRRPRTDMNVASGCPLFFALSELTRHGYLIDDTMFVKIIVDKADI